jgi:hypothetical protein
MSLLRNAGIAVSVLALSVCLSVQSAAASRSQRKIRVLIVDGFSNHDWRLTTELLRGILEPSGLFEVSVSTAPAAAVSPGWEQWKPSFSDYDVVIQTCNDIGGGPSWPREVQIAFEKFVQHGGGALVFHSGNNAFPDWAAYKQMIGLGWRKKTQGDALTVDQREKLVRIPRPARVKIPDTAAAPMW